MPNLGAPIIHWRWFKCAESARQFGKNRRGNSATIRAAILQVGAPSRRRSAGRAQVVGIGPNWGRPNLPGGCSRNRHGANARQDRGAASAQRRPAGVLLVMACAMAWRLAWLSMDVRGCMVMICQWGKDQQQGHTSPLSTCSMTACTEAMTVRQRLSVNA